MDLDAQQRARAGVCDFAELVVLLVLLTKRAFRSTAGMESAPFCDY